MELNSLLDKIYELEGLVLLACKREDSSSDLIRLIAMKSEEVNVLVSKLHSKETTDIVIPQKEKSDLLNEKILPGKDTQHLEEPNSSDDSYCFELEEYAIEEDIPETFPVLPETEKESNNEAGEFVDLQRGKLVFSINERFRFRQQLFENSDADFNNTLALVASMDDYEEAEDYFINEEGFDKTDPIVKEFLGILKRYFK